VQKKFRWFHIETHDESLKLDILGERVTRETGAPGDCATLNARLSETVKASARRLSAGHSSASSQSRCSTSAGGMAHLHGSAEATAHEGRRTTIDIEFD